MTGTEKKSLFLAVGAAAALWFAKKAIGIKVAGIGATKQKKFYVYAGYHENYISSKPMPAPYVKWRAFSSIDRAINYADSFGDEVIFCDNVKYDLPDYLYDALQDSGYEYFKLRNSNSMQSIGKINPNRQGTRVIFKKFPDGEVIAFFPDIVEKTTSWGTPTECLSYAHVGQHGAADYRLIAELRPATAGEYASLLRELKQIGYDDLIISSRV